MSNVISFWWREEKKRRRARC